MPRLGLARIKTDPEYMDGKTRMHLKDWAKGFSNPGYPQVVQLWRKRNSEEHTPLSKEWLSALHAINTRPDGRPTNIGEPYKIFVKAYCYFNLDGEKRWYTENIGFGDQIVNVLEIKNGLARIETLYYKDAPPDLSKVNYDKTPWLVHRVTAIYRDKRVNFFGTMINTAYNDDFIFIVSKQREGLWLPLEKLDFEHTKPLYEKKRIDLPEEPEMPDDRAIGIDVSYWQGDINWELVAEAGIQFCFLRASHGDYADSRHVANVAGATANNIPIVGEYHYLTAETSVRYQAELFAATISDKCKFAVVDVEDNKGVPVNASLVKLFIERFEELKNIPIMIYTSKWMWLSCTNNAPWGKDYPLWVANYNVNEPALPPVWESWDFWQYSNKGKVNGINAEVDMNRFKGTVEELHEYLNFEPPPPVPTLEERMTIAENKIAEYENRITALEEAQD